jgi:predicted Fe-Mo cluster-binding NifX family protein
MDKVLVAFATDDQLTFSGHHFGSAPYFMLFEVTGETTKFIGTLSNVKSDMEHAHAAESKAGVITELLQSHGVQVVVAKRFGGNINRIKNKFVCVVVKEGNILQNLGIIRQQYRYVLSEWNAGATRNIVNFKRAENPD